MTATTLQRLLKYPPSAVFDKSPGAELALRIRNAAGLRWEVTDTTLTVVVGENNQWDGDIVFSGQYYFGPTSKQYALAGKTISQLANELRADGNTVAFESVALGGLGALALISGSGNQDQSNGDHLYVHRSLLWSLMSAYAVEIKGAGEQVQQALRQMRIPQAEGEWLDRWGTLYGVPRLSASDTALRSKIPDEAFRVRVNAIAIEDTIEKITGQHVRLDEPWRQLFTLDESALSGSHRMQDGHFYTYHVIQPVGQPGTDWSQVLPVIHRNKAAGIDVYAQRIEFAPIHVTVQPPVEYSIQYGIMELRAFSNWGANNQILGVLQLDGDPPVVNHLVAQQWQWGLANTEGFSTEQAIAPPRTIVFASVCLSEGPAFGDENFIFARGQVSTEFSPEQRLSDQMRLSDSEVFQHVEMVERITIAEHPYLIDADPLVECEMGFRTETTGHSSPEAYASPMWSGSWGIGSWVPEWRNAGMAMTTSS